MMHESADKQKNMENVDDEVRGGEMSKDERQIMSEKSVEKEMRNSKI